MSFCIQNLSVLAYANGFTLWHYKAGSDDPSQAGNPGFFSRAGDMLNVGDMVMVSGSAGGKLMCLLPDQNGLRGAPLG
jgi:hypothetical protein